MRRLSVIARPCLLATLCLCFLLTGCGGLLNREVRSITPHLEQGAAPGDQTEWQASNITELKNILKQLIRQRSETGKIKLINYSGNISIIRNDMSSVSSNIIREDPIADYTVDYIPYEIRMMVREVLVTIIYYPNRIGPIPEVANLARLTDRIEQAVKSFQSKLVLEVSYYDNEKGADLTALLREAYYRMPERAVGMPVMNSSLFPNQAGSGLNRVVELEFIYPYEPDATRERIEETHRALDALMRELPEEQEAPEDMETPFKALALYDLLCESVAYDAEAAHTQLDGNAGDEADNLYTALVERRAVSAGFALAYMLLCGEAGIECRLVAGRRDNIQYFWNIIRLNKDWYHVDTAADAAAGGTHDWFLKTDEEMLEVARWDQKAVERCESTQYTYDILADILAQTPIEGEEEGVGPEEDSMIADE